MRQGEIWVANHLVGILEEGEDGYTFTYSDKYLKSKNPLPVSLTLPLQTESYKSETLFPCYWKLHIKIGN